MQKLTKKYKKLYTDRREPISTKHINGYFFQDLGEENKERKKRYKFFHIKQTKDHIFSEYVDY